MMPTWDTKTGNVLYIVVNTPDAYITAIRIRIFSDYVRSCFLMDSKNQNLLQRKELFI